VASAIAVAVGRTPPSSGPPSLWRTPAHWARTSTSRQSIWGRRSPPPCGQRHCDLDHLRGDSL